MRACRVSVVAGELTAVVKKAVEANVLESGSIQDEVGETKEENVEEGERKERRRKRKEERARRKIAVSFSFSARCGARLSIRKELGWNWEGKAGRVIVLAQMSKGKSDRFLQRHCL